MKKLVSAKTHSEDLFEAYLEAQGISPDREPNIPGKAKHPDYRAQHGRQVVWFEVKEFDDPRTKPMNGFSPCPAIREKINQARKKFKEYKSECCNLVLHNCKSNYRRTDPEAVLSAAFGEYFQRLPRLDEALSDEPFRFRFHGRSKLNKVQNRSISAIIVLQHYHVNERWVDIWNQLYERQARGEKLPPGASLRLAVNTQAHPAVISHADSVRVIVFENPYARVRFPKDLLNGPLDQRWGVYKDYYTLRWIGADLQKLRDRPEPVPYIFL